MNIVNSPGEKEKVLFRVKKTKASLRELVLDAKNKPCTDCPAFYPDEPWLMELDHRDPSDKIDNIGNLVRLGNRENLIAELEKCDVVCAICHRRRSAKMFGWTSNTFIS